MALTADEQWLLQHLDKQSPKACRELPLPAGRSFEDMAAALEGLLRRKYVWIDGASNLNSTFGQDVELIALLPLGEEWARHYRQRPM